MSVTPGELGAILAALFAVFMFLRILPTVTAMLGLLSVVLLGTTGWLGRVLADTAGWVQHLLGTVTTTVIGASFAGVLTIALAVVYLHDLHPNKPAGARTAWIGVALGALIVAGVTGIPALAGLRSGITSAASAVLGAL